MTDLFFGRYLVVSFISNWQINRVYFFVRQDEPLRLFLQKIPHLDSKPLSLNVHLIICSFLSRFLIKKVKDIPKIPYIRIE